MGDRARALQHQKKKIEGPGSSGAQEPENCEEKKKELKTQESAQRRKKGLKTAMQGSGGTLCDGKYMG